MFARDDDLLTRLHIGLHRAREIFDKQGGAAPVRNLIGALGIEELARGLGSVDSRPGRGSDGNRIVGTELDVGMQEVVRKSGDDVGEALGTASIVGIELVGIGTSVYGRFYTCASRFSDRLSDRRVCPVLQ